MGKEIKFLMKKNRQEEGWLYIFWFSMQSIWEIQSVKRGRMVSATRVEDSSSFLWEGILPTINWLYEKISSHTFWPVLVGSKIWRFDIQAMHHLNKKTIKKMRWSFCKVIKYCGVYSPVGVEGTILKCLIITRYCGRTPWGNYEPVKSNDFSKYQNLYVFIKDCGDMTHLSREYII